MGGLALLGGIAWLWLDGATQPSPSSQQLFEGISYARLSKQEPRFLVIHVLKIDLRQKGVSFLVTPGVSKRELPLTARTTSQFLREFRLQAAINGDGFYPWRSNSLLDYYPKPGDPVKPLGLAASEGVIYSQPLPQAPVLYISKTNQARFDAPVGKVYNAISGNTMLVEKGKVLEGLAGTLEPRTAVGLDKRNRWLFLVIVDGRQPGYSEGVSLAELARLMLELGAYNAMNLDGGGSSAMVVQGNNGQPRVLNSPIDNQIPGRERAVGNHLGVYARR